MNVLAPVLAAERVLTGTQVREILEEAQGKKPRMSRHHVVRGGETYWPPTAPVATHQRPSGLDVYSHGRLIASGVSRAEADRLAREILG